MLITKASKFFYKILRISYDKNFFLNHVKTQHLTCTKHDSIGEGGPHPLDTPSPPPPVNTPLRE